MNGLDILRSGVIQIVDGDNGEKILEFITKDEVGYVGKYRERIPMSENYNCVEVAARNLSTSIGKDLAFHGVGYDDIKAEVLNKALTVKDSIDNRPFTDYKGKVEA